MLIQSDYQNFLVALWMKKNVSRENCVNFKRNNTEEMYLLCLDGINKSHMCSTCELHEHHQKCPRFVFLEYKPFFLIFLNNPHCYTIFSRIGKCQCLCHREQQENNATSFKQSGHEDNLWILENICCYSTQIMWSDLKYRILIIFRLEINNDLRY